MQSPEGFDNASADLTNDDLHRWRFALDISEVIRSTPADWSVRIGLFGSWGSGKTTILRYLSDLLQDDGNIVLNFNPAFSVDFAGVVGALGYLLIEELEKRDLLVEPRVKSFLRKGETWFRRKGSSEVIGAFGDFFKAGKAANAGLDILSQWLEPNGDQIKKIAEKLPNQRFIVLVDDLDRSSPELLPKFLLSLRELLDLPRFTFVLAFDDVVVSKAITNENEAWAEGSDFLEKILDFRFSLPPIDKSGKSKLLTSSLSKYADFVPPETALAVEDLIPDNPRKLKALVRGFRAIEVTLKRHNPNEFEWTDLWLILLLQQESHVLVRKLSDHNTYDDSIGLSYKFNEEMAKRNEPKSKPSVLDALLESARLSAPSLERVRSIIDVIRSRSSMRMHYVLQWFVRPPAVTWKEFDAFIAVWDSTRTPELLDIAMQAHAKLRNDSPQRVQAEVFDALLTRTHESLMAASQDMSLARSEDTYSQAATYRRATQSFLQIPGTLDSQRFESLYQKALYFIAIRGDSGAVAARHAERRFLLELAETLRNTDAVGAFGVLKPSKEETMGIPFACMAERNSLRADLAAVLRPEVEEELHQFLKASNSFERLSEPQQHLVFKWLLFLEAGEWSVSTRASVDAVLASAVQDESAYENIKMLALLWARSIDHKEPDVDREKTKAMVQDSTLIRAVWTVICSRELRTFGLLQLLAIREKLIEAGGSENVMPLDQRLERQLSTYEQSREDVLNSI